MFMNFIKDSIKENNKLIQKLMTKEWLLTTILIINFFELYCIISWDIDIFSKNGIESLKKYFEIKDFLYCIIIFSAIFSILFPIISFCYWFIIFNRLPKKIQIFLTLNENFSNDTNYIDLETLKFQAMQENNPIKKEVYNEEKSKQRNETYFLNLMWGIFTFNIIGWIVGRNNAPILIKYSKDLINYSLSSNFLVKFIILLSFSFLIFYTLLTLYGSMCARLPNKIYFPQKMKNKRAS